jgi:RimJ/RimL family protein N-acetyltransferase
MRRTISGAAGGVSLRPVAAADQPSIDRWAAVVADHLSRTRPYAVGVDHHDPDRGLFWYVIVDCARDVGTVWVELPPGSDEPVLGVYLGEASLFGRGIGTAAVRLAVAEFRGVHPQLSVSLRVRRTNERAIACYRGIGFTITGSGTKSLPSGEVVFYYGMVLTPC